MTSGNSQGEWNQQPYAQQQYAQQAYSYEPPRQRRNGAVIGLIIVLIVLVLVLAGTLVYWLTNNQSGGRGAEGSTSGTSTVVVIETAEPLAPESAPSQAPAPAEPVLPGGSLNSAWAGTSVTSAPFVENVRREYIAYRNSTGNVSGNINVYSSTTGRNYNMRCVASGNNIRCSGGNNAVVYIGN